MLTFGSVCSGIEAASVAWEPLGWRPAWFAEIDPFASAVLTYRWPGVENRGDFTRIEGESPGSIDVLVGGTPCQSFSVAGRRLGMDDPRGNLAIEFLRLARRLRPLWLVWENVPGVLSSGGGRDFGSFLGLLGQLGYGWSYRVLDAQHFGVPQRRRRVFVVGHLGDWRRAAAVLFERESLSGHLAPRREAGAGVAGSLGGGTGERGWCDDFDRAGAFVPETGYAPRGKHNLNRREDGDTLVVGTLSAIYAKQSHNGMVEMANGLIAHSLRADGFDGSEDGTGRGTPLVLVPIDMRQASRTTDPDAMNRQGLGVGQEGDPSPTLSTLFVPAVAFIVNAAESCAKQSHAREAEVARCIDSNGSFASAQGGTVVAYRTAGNCGPFEQGDVTACLNTATDPNQNILLGRSAVRRLTPREAERLQGFEDNYTLVPYRGKPASDGPRYKALGNSFAVPVVRWIGARIQMVDDMAKSAVIPDS